MKVLELVKKSRSYTDYMEVITISGERHQYSIESFLSSPSSVNFKGMLVKSFLMSSRGLFVYVYGHNIMYNKATKVGDLLQSFDSSEFRLLTSIPYTGKVINCDIRGVGNGVLSELEVKTWSILKRDGILYVGVVINKSMGREYFKNSFKKGWFSNYECFGVVEKFIECDGYESSSISKTRLGYYL